MEKTAFFGKYHRILKRLVIMKGGLLASYITGVRNSSTLHLLPGKSPQVQLCLPISNGHNNLRNNLGLLEIRNILKFYLVSTKLKSVNI